MAEPSLEYFIAIAEDCNISQAAKRLNISQQGLSNYLSKLESHYSTKLITRKPTMQLTEAGRMVYDAAREVHRIKKTLHINITHLNETGNRLNIGIYAPNAGMLMDFIPLIEFGRQYPQMSYNVTEESNRVLRDMLAQGKLDLIVSAYHNADDFPEFTVERLYSNQEYIIISTALMKQYFPDLDEDRMAEFRKGVRLEEFRNVPLVIPPADCGFSRQLSEYCQKNHVKLNQIGEISNRYLSNSMVFDGVVFGFCDERYLPHLLASRPAPEIGKICAFPVISPGINNNVGIMYRKGDKHPEYFDALIQAVLNHNKKYNP